jgi:Ser/Thr protein kinase RdoA (MazF antagonist)
MTGRESENVGHVHSAGMDGFSSGKCRAALGDLLQTYGLADARVELINESENTTYRIDPTDGGRPAVLRLYRAGQRTEAQIRSELDWMEALRAQAAISTPQAITTRGGERITELALPSGGTRSCVLFEFLAGEEPPSDALGPWFEQLGAISAGIHLHGRTWRRPPSFERPLLDYEALIGARAVWGSWERAPGLDASAVTALRRVSEQISRRLAEYGQAPDRFGLIHGDLRLANLLADGSRIHVIDFDDCGTSWYLYDLSTSMSLLEHLPEAESLVQAWLHGYQRLLPLTMVQVDMARHLIMMRRIQVLSWFGRNIGSPLVLEYAPVVVPATVAAGESYLRLGGRRVTRFLPNN